MRLARLRFAPAPGSLTWLAGGAAVGAAGGLVLAAGGASVLLVAVLGVVGAVAGLWGCSQHRAHLSRRWRTDVDAELPAVADLLSFSVTAGESLVAGIDRVAETLRGPLAVELQRAGEQMRGGSSVEVALRSVSGGVASFERFVDAVVVALERGTPLADVLRAQADDVRSARRRTLLEMAGRKDVLMLVPVVFLILPTVVLIALFPAAQALRLLSS
jgi:tight adherence protein C